MTFTLKQKHIVASVLIIIIAALIGLLWHNYVAFKKYATATHNELAQDEKAMIQMSQGINTLFQFASVELPTQAKDFSSKVQAQATTK